MLFNFDLPHVNKIWNEHSIDLLCACTMRATSPSHVTLTGALLVSIWWSCSSCLLSRIRHTLYWASLPSTKRLWLSCSNLWSTGELFGYMLWAFNAGGLSAVTIRYLTQKLYGWKVYFLGHFIRHFFTLLWTNIYNLMRSPVCIGQEV